MGLAKIYLKIGQCLPLVRRYNPSGLLSAAAQVYYNLAPILPYRCK